MSSDKQRAANRANGKLGGPKTAEGKAAIRFNALKHGLTAQEVIIPGEDPAEYDQFKNQVWADVNPETALEGSQVDQLVIHSWCQKRSAIAKSKLLNSDRQLAKYPWNMFSGFEHVDRYDTANVHKLDTALELLVKLKKFHRDWPVPASPSKNYIPYPFQTTLNTVAICTFVHHPHIIYL